MNVVGCKLELELLLPSLALPLLGHATAILAVFAIAAKLKNTFGRIIELLQEFQLLSHHESSN